MRTLSCMLCAFFYYCSVSEAFEFESFKDAFDLAYGLAVADQEWFSSDKNSFDLFYAQDKVQIVINGGVSMSEGTYDEAFSAWTPFHSVFTRDEYTMLGVAVRSYDKYVMECVGNFRWAKKSGGFGYFSFVRKVYDYNDDGKIDAVFEDFDETELNDFMVEITERAQAKKKHDL